MFAIFLDQWCWFVKIRDFIFFFVKTFGEQLSRFFWSWIICSDDPAHHILSRKMNNELFEKQSRVIVENSVFRFFIKKIGELYFFSEQCTAKLLATSFCEKRITNFHKFFDLTITTSHWWKFRVLFFRENICWVAQKIV